MYFREVWLFLIAGTIFLAPLQRALEWSWVEGTQKQQESNQFC